MDVHSVKLAFHGMVCPVFVKTILDYVLSYNVQQLNITCLGGNKIEFPLSLSSSQSLKHLTLIGNTYDFSIIIPPTRELPALTTLNLQYFTLYDDKCVDLFSNCANLKNLTLKNCRVVGLNGFNICHHGLSSLTLEDGGAGVNVVTPQLKNLVIKYWQGIPLVSAPNLSSLHYKAYSYPLDISTDLPHLENVDICIPYPFEDKATPHKIVCLLQHLHNVKSLTLNLEIIEELRALINFRSAQKLMREFQVVLHQMKENRETHTTHLASHMSHMATVLEQVEKHTTQPDMKMKRRFWERMSCMKSYWEDRNEQLKNGYKNADHTMSMLWRIESVLAKLPMSLRDKLQERFSGLCVEADTIMDNMMDHLKIQCDKRPRVKCLVS